jgi:ATP-dependent Lon protease
MGPATEAAWHALRRSVHRGDDGLHLLPLILNGPAGIGKSVWARRLAEMCAVPSCVIEVGSGSAGFRIAGLERGWSSAGPGRPLETILQARIANPILIVDDICKMQTFRRRMIWNSGADFGSEGAGSSSSCYAAWR